MYLLAEIIMNGSVTVFEVLLLNMITFGAILKYNFVYNVKTYTPFLLVFL